MGPVMHDPPSLKYWKQAFLSSWRESDETRRKHRFRLCLSPPFHIGCCISPHVLSDAERGGDSLSVAANSSYRAWANTFTTKECDDLRSQWNLFFACWEEEEGRGVKTQGVKLHTGLQSPTFSPV